mgnify:CR=1 FL=1
MTAAPAQVHLQVAEAGKRCALRGDLQGALERYRHALRLALSQKANAVFLHHYTECILDALEEAGHREQALETTERALAERPEGEGTLAQMVLASLSERHVLLLFQLGRVADADAALADALRFGGPVLKDVAEARRRRLTITKAWIAGVKRRHRSATVREGVLRHSDAEAGETYFKTERADV